MKTAECAMTGGSWEGVSHRDWSDWIWQSANRVHTIPQLAKILGKTPGNLGDYVHIIRNYPFCITPYYLSLINLANENDPLRMQCIPDAREIHFSMGGVPDPLEEERDMPVAGLIHRYPDRCLTVVTYDCMTYCRHCNRKRMWKSERTPINRRYLQTMIDYIGEKKAIREVIVSGGDPLTMEEGHLEWFLKSLRSIPHVEVLRIGSRVPVVLPMRVTRDLCSMLRKYRPLWFNTQFNHPREITRASARACEMLLDAGIPVSNQSVLLRGINDEYETMRELLYGLQRISVRPYYLFQCDPVEGTDHFRTDIAAGLKMMEKLWENMPGLCMPQYVLDAPGRRGKVPLFPSSPMSCMAVGAYGSFQQIH
ncbi:MAG: KamA family radical SAM protein [Deltaproteobacteria bacterium]|nr:KamA family radical SAM protein [Deltaproteobacteria bacterium]